jgi:hypothetical protein
VEKPACGIFEACLYVGRPADRATSSWTNLVERLFADLTRQRIRRDGGTAPNVKGKRANGKS